MPITISAHSAHDHSAHNIMSVVQGIHDQLIYSYYKNSVLDCCCVKVAFKHYYSVSVNLIHAF